MFAYSSDITRRAITRPTAVSRMNNRREMMWRELGLSPLFVRRQATQAEPADSLPEYEPAARQIARVAAPATCIAAHESAVAPQPIGAPAGKDAHAAENRRQRILGMEWIELKASVAGCTDCALHASRTQTVFGVGDEQASVLFVGEGPGADEDLQGEPFVGQAGKLLDNMLAAIDLKRGDDVYIANIVKCRPPKNRNPEPVEARCCEPYLARQIQLLKPKLIVALGKVAAQNLLDSDAPVGALRSKLLAYDGIPLIVTYHPAYLLRSLGDKAKAWEDLCFIRDNLRQRKAALA
jgi:uracil-DNA glycosylase family 4